MTGTGKAQKSFKHVPLAPATRYAAEDADMAAEQLRSTGETVYKLGTIEARAEGQAQTVVV